MIGKPHLWTANKETDLGDGLYGTRRTGTITIDADTQKSIGFVVSDVDEIIDAGGYFETGEVHETTNIQASLGVQLDSSTAWSFSAAGGVSKINGGFGFYSISSTARSSAVYEVWVTYTKSS